MALERRMWLGEIRWTGSKVEMNYGIDEHAFTVAIQYGSSVDFNALEVRYGKSHVERILFHILAFEANKALSFGPVTVDPGPHAHWVTPAFLQLWWIIGHKVWAQWRYQNDWPDYAGPRWLTEQESRTRGRSSCNGDEIMDCERLSPIVLNPSETKILAFCGGGKDSLVAVKLFERAKIPFATLAYSHSVYGPAELQHQLVDELLDTCQPTVREKQWITDTFYDPSTQLLCERYQVQEPLAAETPSSIFGALPLALSQGYCHVSLGHERSADVGNLIWDKTGEDVNHQWGKSLEAQTLINDYIQQELVLNFTYFSLLKPLYDVLIFNMLEQDLKSIAYTHSCNIEKPWCKRCPKCAYVWLNYMAYLPVHAIAPMFGGENLLDLDENQLAYRQMLGLEAHTPFECIGQVAEVRLAFELIKRKGLRGKALDVYTQRVPPQDWNQVIKGFGHVVNEDNVLPPGISEDILPLMENAAKAARDKLTKVLIPPNVRNHQDVPVHRNINLLELDEKDQTSHLSQSFRQTTEIR